MVNKNETTKSFDVSLLEYDTKNMNGRKKIETYLPKFNNLILNLVLANFDLKQVSKLINITQIYVNFFPDLKDFFKYYEKLTDDESKSKAISKYSNDYYNIAETFVLEKKIKGDRIFQFINISSTLKTIEPFLIFHSHFINLIYIYDLSLLKFNNQKSYFNLKNPKLKNNDILEKSISKVFKKQKETYKTIKENIKKQYEKMNIEIFELGVGSYEKR